MSTKHTRALGPGFRLFTDDWEGAADVVYLEIYGDVEIEVTRSRPSDPSSEGGSRVMIGIPISILETIRKMSPFVDLEEADDTDEDLLALATQRVDGRISKHQAATTNRQRALAAMYGSISMGGVETPREEQIQRMFETYVRHRDLVRKIRQQMSEHQIS